MATDINRLKNAINNALDDYDNIAPADLTAARLDFADKLASAIVAEIKSASITYTNGLVAGSVAVGGIFNHAIN